MGQTYSTCMPTKEELKTKKFSSVSFQGSDRLNDISLE